MGEEEQEVPNEWTDHMVRCAVQGLLKEMNQSTLAKLSPLSQILVKNTIFLNISINPPILIKKSAISNIANWKYANTLSTEKCRDFGKWYKEYRKTSAPEFSEEPPKDSRLTFHPEHEIPQMRLWYKRYKNPSDAKLNFFRAELNKGHVRQEKPKVTIEKLKNWWKNERQREKRISMREDSKESDKKEIAKLKAEAAKSAARRRFIDQDSEKVKVAKVVPSPQKPSEARSRSKTASEQLDPSLIVSAQQRCIQQPGLISTQTQVVPPLDNRQSESIVSLGRQIAPPRGFVSLLQQSPVPYDSRNPGPQVSGCSPVIPGNQGPGLVVSGPVTRISPGTVHIWSSADGSEIRSCDYGHAQISSPGQITEGSRAFVEMSPDKLDTIPGQVSHDRSSGEVIPGVSDMQSGTPLESETESYQSTRGRYTDWNYKL